MAVKAAFLSLKSWWFSFILFFKGVAQNSHKSTFYFLFPQKTDKRGADDFALYPWHESIDMLLDEAEGKGITVLTPIIGAKVIPDETTPTKWW